MQAQIIQDAGSPVVASPSLWWTVKWLLKEWRGRLLNWLGIPGAVQPMTIDDPLTGQRIEIEVGVFLTRISVNGRDYFFKRTTGKFDGTGGSVCG